MFLETIPIKIQGLVKIIDKETGEVLVDTTNDVLYGNMSTALAQSLIGNTNSLLSYMAFGNGGAYISPTGTIAYKPSLGGPNSLVKNPTANLYNTIYAKLLSNEQTIGASFNTQSEVYLAAENYSTNYEDMIADVVIGYNEPPVGITTSTTIQQLQVDNSAFIGASATINTGTSTTFDPNTFVFNEIGLFAGTPNLFSGQYTATITDVDNFINTTPNYSTTTAGTKSKLMLTHVIFHPIQKSQNRSLEIIYDLRIQIGTS
jgi:hypothetical protein